MDKESDVIKHQMEHTRTQLTDKLELLEHQVADTVTGAAETVEKVRQTVSDTVTGATETFVQRNIRMSIDEGQLRPDTDPLQMLFEIHGLILALHHDARFLRHAGAEERARAGFERVLAHWTAPSHTD